MEPLFELSVVFSRDGFIVLTDVCEDFAEVFLWFGVDFHMDLTTHLRPCSKEVLWRKQG